MRVPTHADIDGCGHIIGEPICGGHAGDLSQFARSSLSIRFEFRRVAMRAARLAGADVIVPARRTLAVVPLRKTEQWDNGCRF